VTTGQRLSRISLEAIRDHVVSRPHPASDNKRVPLRLRNPVEYCQAPQLQLVGMKRNGTPAIPRTSGAPRHGHRTTSTGLCARIVL